ncbi:MAG: chemotaxis protein CheW [Spirochaetes bacterium]|nr:chemotaxis protein CheW [Spirochaetota bacterium]
MTMQAELEKKSDSRTEEKKERADRVDFKMVTFSLGGKEYGIDIMNVKEIAKASKFTYVPNAAPFVRGVYNLRGEIISIIDLRTMFHLPSERKQDGSLESLLILRVEEHVFGVIVDNIDKVVGISKSSLQPPHPIFGDINVKYIRGIVENAGKLYIILDVEKIFMVDKDLKGARKEAAYEAPKPGMSERAFTSMEADGGDLDLGFIEETLFSFRHFAVTPVNDAWVKARFGQWKGMRKGTDLQLKEPGEADQYLETFYSRCSSVLWDSGYADQVLPVLPAAESRTINVWNPGCGRGHETYSFALLLRRKYPQARIKIWANDSDLLAISMAPNMTFQEQEIPEAYREHMVKGKNGYSFSQAVRDSIFFEFHDVQNANPLPPLDIILCRDTLSFMDVVQQKRLIAEFSERLKASGIVILGGNEKLVAGGWKSVSGDEAVSAYGKD